MKVIVGSRQSGKTYEAIRLANNRDAVLVVKSHDRSRQIRFDPNYPPLENEPVTYRDLQTGCARGNQDTYVIDNLDHFLAWIVDVPLEGFTITSDPEVLDE